MPSYFLAILRLPFQGKERMQSFIHLSIVFLLYTALLNQSRKSSNFLVFHISCDILSRSTALLLLIFVCNRLGSSWENCPSFISSWLLIIFVRGLSVTSGKFPNTFLKSSFYIHIRSCQADFSFTIEEFFYIINCLPYVSSFFIIDRVSYFFIRPWIYYFCSFWYVCVRNMFVWL